METHSPALRAPAVRLLLWIEHPIMQHIHSTVRTVFIMDADQETLISDESRDTVCPELQMSSRRTEFK